MERSQAYLKKSVIRFKRWSHKAYAIFCSIGKQIHIGELSGIIQKINTVKSQLVHEAVCITDDFFKKLEDGEEKMLSSEPVLLADISLINQKVVSAAVNPAGESFIVTEFHIYYNIIKAFIGPFLFSNKFISVTLFDRILYFKK